MIRYRIKQGESLSLIAKRYGFHDWQPIWIYNTRFSPDQRLPGSDPGKVPAGATILIPRRKAEYDIAIRALEQLHRSAEIDAQQHLQQLEKDLQSMRGMGNVFDTTAAVGTAIVGVVGVAIRSLGALGTRYAALRIGKELLKPAQAAAEHFLPEGEASDGTVDIKVTAANIVVKSAGTAGQKHAIAWATKLPVSPGRLGASFASAALKDAGQESGKEVLKAHGMRAEDSRQFVELLCAVLEGGASAIEKIRPSWLAQAWIGWRTGERPEESFAAAADRIKASKAASQARIRQTIERLAAERDAMYQNG
jgi:hypothetical protein